MTNSSAKIIFTVRSDGNAAELAHNILNHLIDNVHDDWGEDAWGGYDGPVLRDFSAHVEEG